MRSKLVLSGVAGVMMVLSAITVAQAQSSTTGKPVPARSMKMSKKPVAVSDTSSAAATRHAAKVLYAKKHPGYITTSARASKLSLKNKASARHASAKARRASHIAMTKKGASASSSLKAAKTPKASALKSGAKASSLKAGPMDPKSAAFKTPIGAKAPAESFLPPAKESKAPAFRMPAPTAPTAAAPTAAPFRMPAPSAEPAPAINS
jgi:hypothetical protein